MTPRRCPLCERVSPREIFVKVGFHLVECATCELVYVADPPSDDEIRRLYSLEAGYHRELLDPGSPARLFHTQEARRHFELIQRHVARGAHPRRGCSAGFFLEVAQHHGWHVEGLELSREMALATTRRLRCTVLTEPLEEAAASPGAFDVVTLWDVLEHVPDPARTLGAVYRFSPPTASSRSPRPTWAGSFPVCPAASRAW
jgi:hypothetical protein